MSIPRFAIHRPVTVFMVCGVVVLLGAVSLLRLPVDLMPDLEMPSLSIRVNYDGVGPREIEESITRPIERSVAAVAGLEQVNSTSSEGSSQVRLSFVWGTNINVAADDVRSRLDRLRGQLPDDADTPTIFKFDATQFPIIFIAVGGDFDPVTLREMAEQEVAPHFERVTGVAAVEVRGGLRRQIMVELSRDKTTALGLPVDRVVQLLRSENQDLPLGEINEGDLTYLLRSPGQFTSLEDIRNLVIMTREGVPVYLRDVADVRDATEDHRAFTRVDGTPGVRMTISKQSGENSVAVAERVRSEIERINREMPGVSLRITRDQAVFIEQSIAAVREAVLLGSGLVILIIFTFLRNFRSTLIICTSIPISVIGTFALLYFGGYTLNTMTFGGLALGVGMIVDASIVVLENAQRHMEMGKDRVQAAIDGSEEIWSAIVASTLTHIAVFVPLFFLAGFSSILFKQLSVVVICALTMSLFVAVTVVPVLCAKLMRAPVPEAERTGWTGWLFGTSERWLRQTEDGYRRLLHRALAHRPTVVMAAAGLFVLAILALPLLQFELMPQTDEGEVRVDAELATGTRIERTEAVMTQIEQMIWEAVPEATNLITTGGGGGWRSRGTNTGQVDIQLVRKEQRTRSSEEIAQTLRRELAGLPGVTIRTRAAGGNWQLNRVLGAGGDARLALEIRGHDLEDNQRLSRDARRLLETVPGVTDVRFEREEGRPEMAIRVDRDKAATLGMTVNQVATTLRTNIAGTQAAYYRERGEEYPIIVRLREEDRGRVTDVGDVLVTTPDGLVVQAKNLLDLQPDTGPVEINRKNQQRLTTINAEIEIPLSEAVARIQEQVIPQLDIPRDFTVGFGAELEEQQRAFTQLQLLLVLAILLVYAVMASQYESLRDPFVIMFSVPLAAIGVVGILMLTNTPFSIQAYIGVIMLAGIVVNNAILLVDYTTTLRRRDKMPLREAVELAGRRRLRPILMTTLTTMLGLVPMSLGFGEGGELQAPLARVVIGGLAASTLVTLVFVPTIYTIFEEGFKGWRHVPGPEPARAPEGAVGRHA